MEPQEIVTRTTKIWLADDGILRATYLPGPYPTRLFTTEAEAIAWLKGSLA